MVWRKRMEIGTRSISRVVLVLVLTCVLLLPPNTAALRGSFSASAAAIEEQDPLWPASPFLNDTFENQPPGGLPEHWYTSGPADSFTVDNSTDDNGRYRAYSGNQSARFFVNVPLGTSSPVVYRKDFTEQTNLTVVIFALRIANVSEDFAGLEVSVDGEPWNGSNIIFSNEMTILYREPGGNLALIRDNYSFDRWYKIEFIMNIPQGYYQILIDDHLEIANAQFTDPITKIQRIAIREPFTLGNVTAYLDQVVGYACVRVPDDFPTIQEAIDHAAPGQGVYVSPGRVYFENIVIDKSLELIGSDNSSRAVIDGHFRMSQGEFTDAITVTGASKETELQTVSVTASSYDEDHPPQLAIDGIEDPSNYWQSDKVLPQVLEVDLGSSVAVSKVTTHFYDADKRNYTYLIIVSNDGSLWTNAVPSKVGSGVVTDTFPQISARFVGIVITNNTANQYAQIEEVKVYSPRTSNMLVTDVQIHGFIIQNSNGDGIYVYGSNIRIFDNVITNSGTDSPQSSNSGHGIHMSGFNNRIENNIITRSLNAGIYLESTNSTVKNNTISSNLFGLKCVGSAAENLIYRNRFIGNTYQGLPQSDEPSANRWDHGYPINESDIDAGGNYWSDFASPDVYSGSNQDQPGSDGICDKVNGIQPRGAIYAQDNYPLFLIQNISQAPLPSNVSYNDNVTISGGDLSNVPDEYGFVYVNYTLGGNTTNATIQLIISGTNKTATIPAQPYGTQVRYYVSVGAKYWISANGTTHSVWANSSIIAYFVNDTIAPTISNVTTTPPLVFVGQVFNVTASVTDGPANASARASGVDRVFLSWTDNAAGSVWNGTMNRIGNSTFYSILVPKQYEKQTYRAVIYAYDKAGILGTSNFTIPILNLANMTVRNSADPPPAEDPCVVDFEVLSRGDGKWTLNVTIANTGDAVLQWNLTYLDSRDMSWLTFNSTGNTIAANGTNTLNITVNTATLLEPCNYVGKIWITGNGTTTQWGLVVSVKTRYVVIDGAFGSSLAPDRCDVGSTQNFSYHVIWAHDSSDAVNGKLNITNAGQKFRDVNGTGWVPWQNTSNVSSNVTFPVTNVSFIYKDPTNGKNYTITNFTMKAPILNTIWDRVNITIKIPYSRIDVCTDANPVVKAVYETDGLNFTGNVTLSPTRYCDVSPNNRTGERVSGIPDYITAIGIIDPQYHLKAFNSSVVACVWDRIRILGGGVSSPNVNVGENGTFWVIVIYEWDNRMFKGSYPSSVRMGQAYVDVYDGDNKKVLEGARMNWSSERDRWEYSVAFDSPGTRTFVVSGVDDYQYNLTKTKDSVGPLSITWGQSSWWNLWTIQPSQTSPVQTTSANGSSVITWPQNPFGSAEAASQVWIIVVAVVLVSCISAIILWVLGIKRNRRKRRSRV